MQLALLPVAFAAGIVARKPVPMVATVPSGLSGGPEGGLTAVFWQEGAVVCVLVSDIETEEVVQLAFAKAMP